MTLMYSRGGGAFTSTMAFVTYLTTIPAKSPLNQIDRPCVMLKLVPVTTFDLVTHVKSDTQETLKA